MSVREYKGKLTEDDAIIQRARRTFFHQTYRCTNPKRRDYKWYGAKGIKVEYSQRQFIHWYQKQAKNYKGIWNNKTPVVGRIDHNANYSLDNIELISHKENLDERNDRVKLPRIRKLTDFEVECIKYLLKHSTLTNKQLSNIFNVDASNISRINTGDLWKNT